MHCASQSPACTSCMWCDHLHLQASPCACGAASAAVAVYWTALAWMRCGCCCWWLQLLWHPHQPGLALTARLTQCTHSLNLMVLQAASNTSCGQEVLSRQAIDQHNMDVVYNLNQIGCLPAAALDGAWWVPASAAASCCAKACKIRFKAHWTWQRWSKAGCMTTGLHQ